MLTNTDVTAAQPSQTAATTIAIEDAERSCRAALRDIGRLIRAGEVSAIDAADLETETVARFIAQARELETRGTEAVAPPPTADRVACAEAQRQTARSGRSRGKRPRGLSAPARALRERQMCVVATGRVSSDVLRGLWLDDDEETLATRGELAAAGLL
jgi:hypothetical protein